MCQRNERGGGIILSAPLTHTHILKNGACSMKENINYLGMVNLLRSLQAAGLVSQKEARKIAARLKTEIGSDVIVSL